MNALLVDQATLLRRPPTNLPEPRRMPRFERSIDLAAVPTALLCARLFVDSTLWHWGARFLEGDAELLAVELVGHSVEDCGVLDEEVRLSQLAEVNVIRLRLLGFERSIGIEVWDSATEPARLPAPDVAMDLHGLALVDARAKHWGSVTTPHGRVTWAELDVYDRTPAGLPIRRCRPNPYPGPPTVSVQRNRPDIELLRRVRNGLESL